MQSVIYHMHFGMNMKIIKMSLVQIFKIFEHALWILLHVVSQLIFIVLRLSIEMVSFSQFLKVAYPLLLLRSHKAYHSAHGWKNKNSIWQCLKAVNYFIDLVTLAFRHNSEIFSLCFWAIIAQAVCEQFGRKIRDILRVRWCTLLHHFPLFIYLFYYALNFGLLHSKMLDWNTNVHKNLKCTQKCMCSTEVDAFLS